MASETETEGEEAGVNETPTDPASPVPDQLAKLLRIRGVDVDCSCAVALGILCQEAVQAAGLMLFNNVHNQQLGQMAEQAVSMKGIIELHRSGAAPLCKPQPPPKESDAGASDEVTKALVDLVLGIFGQSSGVLGGNNSGSGTSEH